MILGIAVAQSNLDAVKTFELIEKDRVKLGLSIGAMIPDGGSTFDKKAARYVVDDIDLVETSVVGIPDNPRSFVDYAVKALGGFLPERGDGSKSDLRAAAKRAALVDHSAGAIEDLLPDAPEDEDVELTDEAAQALLDALNLHPVPVVETKSIEETDDETTETPATIQADADPDATKTRVTVWEEEAGATIEVDTGRKRAQSNGDHSAQGEGSETAGGSASSKTAVPELEAGADVEAPVTDPVTVKALMGQIQAARGETDVVRKDFELRIKALEGQRDEAVRLAASVIDETGKVLDKLAKTPIGRKTGYVEATAEFEDLKHIYGEDVRHIMTKGSTPAITRGN